MNFSIRKVDSKKEKVIIEMKGTDNQIVIPSTKQFLEAFDRHVTRSVSRIDAEVILNTSDDRNRISVLISKFDEVATEALIETLIEVGYKREEKKSKWKIWNWF
jgi:hypothetical protein